MNQDPVAEIVQQRLWEPISRRRALQLMGLAGGLGAAGALAGCGTSASTGQSGSSGHIGGTLVFFGWSAEDGLPSIAKPWLQSHHVTLKSTYAAATDQVLTKMRTGGKGSVSVLTINKDVLPDCIAAGILQPLDMSRLPNAKGLFPGFQDAPWTHHQAQTYAIPLVWGNEPIVYNPKKVTSLPPKYTDFANPKYKGQLTTLDDPYSNIYLFAKSLGFRPANRLTQSQLNQTIDAMLKVKPNIVSLAASFGDLGNLLIAGNATIALDGWGYLKVQAAQKGVDLALGAPAMDGSFYWSDSYSIAADAPNVDTAYAYINHMMSPKINATLADALGSGCTIASSYNLQSKSVAGLYPFSSVRQRGAGALAASVIFPPIENEGDIMGAQAWTTAYEQFRV